MRDTCLEMIGGLIRHPEQLADVLELVRYEDVPFPDLAQVYAQLTGLIADGITPTPAVMFDRQPEQAVSTYETAVIDCFEAIPAEPLPRAEIIREEAERGRLRQQAIDALDAAQNQDFYGAMAELHTSIQNALRPTHKPVSVTDELSRWRDRLTQPREGIRTGFESLDRRLTALGAGELSIVAARPGMGKSAFALDVARAQHKDVLFFSLEMSADELISRAMSALAQVNSRSFRSRNFNEAELVRINGAQQAWNIPLHIVDNPAVTVEEIEAQTAKAKPSLVVIDYLQLMEGKGDNRSQQIGHITRRLKRLSKKHNCHVMCLSQLNRGVENRTNKRPTMADLRESGEIEQDADQILFLYRHGVYVENFPHYDVTEINLAKFRQGEPGTEHLTFHGEHTTFKNSSDMEISQYKGALNESVQVFNPTAARGV
ncbi:MAG: DnaB helicase C-terminal domain-containing protein [Pseudomonadota bacterium]